MNQIIQQLTDFIQQQTLKQKIIIAGVLIGFISTIIVMVMWANRTEFELLYSGLDPSAASAIVSDMRNSKIEYRLENGGSTIYAPREAISELRLKHAQAGYLKDSVTGYELFENNKMGMTTFMQKLNMKRALEGELMRTINQFPEVSQSRVHLVIPENRLFEDEKSGSASVVLHMRPGAVLHQKQLKGVAALVANSVDGIEPENVVVMDGEGSVLLEGPKDNGLIGEVGNQYELQKAVEDELQDKVSEIVGGIVGPQNTVVKVSVEMDFDQVERTLEQVDPENVVVLSQEKYTESSKSQVDSSDYVIEKETSNYELSKIHERFVSNAGDIKRMSVAVLVNGRYVAAEDGGENAELQYMPRSDEELRQIAALVKSAVGYNEDRGDIVEVQNMQLSGRGTMMTGDDSGGGLSYELWQQLITYGMLALALILGFILLKGLLKTSVSKLALPGAAPAADMLQSAGEDGQQKSLPPEPEVSEDAYIKKLSPEARAQLRAKDKMTQDVIKFASEKPEDATKLIRSWLTETGA